MSIQAALKFIQLVQNNDQVHEQIETLGIDGKLQDIVELAQKKGFNFTCEELRKAHGCDWNMRARYFNEFD